MPTWPASLPQYPLVDTYEYGFEDNVRRFQADIGAPIERAATSDDVVVWSGTYRIHKDDIATFWTFYNETIVKGIEPFDMPLPHTGETVTVTLLPPKPPPMRDVAGVVYDVELSFRVRP